MLDDAPGPRFRYFSGEEICLSEGRKIADLPPPLLTRQTRLLAGALIENLRRIFGYVGSYFSREHVLSLADQAVVSGANFFTTLLIARWSGPSQLGIYALGLSVLLSLQGFQEFSYCSTISNPKIPSGGRYC